MLNRPNSANRLACVIWVSVALSGFGNERTGSTVADAVRKAFISTSDGWSSDEVLLQDELNAQFIRECRKVLPNVSESELNWALINLRKAGKLTNVKVTRRRSDRHDEYRHAAEIASRPDVR